MEFTCIRLPLILHQGHYSRVTFEGQGESRVAIYRRIRSRALSSVASLRNKLVIRSFLTMALIVAVY